MREEAGTCQTTSTSSLQAYLEAYLPLPPSPMPSFPGQAFLGLGKGVPNAPAGRPQLTRREDAVPPAPGVIKQNRASWCLAQHQVQFYE